MNGLILLIIIFLVVWVLFWKGLALWVSAGRKEKAWFIALLIFNTFGILEIIYLISRGRIIIKLHEDNSSKKKTK